MWMVTPDPDMPYSLWSCASCGATDQHGPESGPERRDHIDGGASRHVQQYGHAVMIQHGTARGLFPLECEAPAQQRHPEDGRPLSSDERAQWERMIRRMS